MLFTSSPFLFFFLPLLLVVYYFPLFKGRTYRNVVLFLFSLVFYAWGAPRFLSAMLTAILVNWLLVLLMTRATRGKKVWLAATVAFDVLLLGFFKYASFLSEQIAVFTGHSEFFIYIALPLGISFVTFQLMSYVFDVYYGKATAQKNPFNLALFISLFPQLIAGPIVRYRQIEREITERDDKYLGLGTGGLRRFAYGLGKKVLIANFLAQLADNAFNFGPTYSVMFAWLGAIAYTLQIYFDFSGYSDMAIGLGQMFGFHFPENFNYPYVAGSVTEFWRRWHMSLTSWFRDYVYLPLGGNRVKKVRWVFNVFVVWFLTGVWHGANWTFVLWGLIYFFALIFEKITGIARKSNVLTRLWTFLIVVVAFVVFRSAGLSAARRYVMTMFGVGASGFCGMDFIGTLSRTWLVLLVAIVGATPLVSKVFQALKTTKWNWLEYCWLLVVFVVSLLEILCSTYNPFIYFNF